MTDTRSTERARLGVARGQAYWRGRGRGPGLVLLNGYGASADAWPGQWMQALASRHTVVTVDVRGGGRSRFAQKPFTIRDLAEDVVAVLDEVGLSTAVVLGLSMGGMVAQELALVAPERVRGLVLVGTRPPVPRFVPPPLRSNLRLLLPAGRGRSLEDYFRDLWAAAAAPGFAGAHPDRLDELARQSAERPTPRAMLVHQMRAMSAWAHAERLTRISVPTAVVHGALDSFAPVANGRVLAELIPGASYDEVPDVGHLIPLEAPDRLDAAIARVSATTEPAATTATP